MWFMSHKHWEYGSHLRAIRAAAGMSQHDLAILLEVGDATIKQWESDRRKPPEPSPAVISDRLGFALEDLYLPVGSVTPVVKLPLVLYEIPACRVTDPEVKNMVANLRRDFEALKRRVLKLPHLRIKVATEKRARSRS